MIRINEIWLATEPLNMRAGPDKALARVIQVFGSARPHCAYLFANKRGNRMKVLVHDGLGIWLCARRLNRGKLHWGESSRREQLDAVQGKLLDELIDSDLAAIEVELDQAMTEEQKAARLKQQPKRTPLPPELPRTLIHHEPENTQCRCGCQLKRIGEDISEKLDYVPGELIVERHIRGKWACDSSETLTQAQVPPQVIDKGIPTAGLLAQVLVAKYADHECASSMIQVEKRIMCQVVLFKMCSPSACYLASQKPTL